jgi:hypothetical protein
MKKKNEIFTPYRTLFLSLLLLLIIIITDAVTIIFAATPLVAQQGQKFLVF